MRPGGALRAVAGRPRTTARGRDGRRPLRDASAWASRHRGKSASTRSRIAGRQTSARSLPAAKTAMSGQDGSSSFAIRSASSGASSSSPSAPIVWMIADRTSGLGSVIQVRMTSIASGSGSRATRSSTARLRRAFDVPTARSSAGTSVGRGSAANSSAAASTTSSSSSFSLPSASPIRSSSSRTVAMSARSGRWPAPGIRGTVDRRHARSGLP